jgi:hypothetical protein
MRRIQSTAADTYRSYEKAEMRLFMERAGMKRENRPTRWMFVLLVLLNEFDTPVGCLDHPFAAITVKVGMASFLPIRFASF